jgi:LuxR family transcriptional regulator, maltose regulon positive regulatory protein
MQRTLRTRTVIPPTRLRQIYRYSLLAKMQEGTQRALTLVIAPAGFGKTCLTAAWAQTGSMPVAWLTLQTTDGQSVQFFTYLIRALQNIDNRIGQSSTILMQSGDFEAALYSLVNDISSVDGDIALVLDDYHNIQTLETNQILQFLLDNRPNGFHLIILSRIFPDLALTRLRANDQVVELGSIDLRFTLEEEKSFLEEIMDLHLPDETRQKLNQATEGWPVGLQLAAIALTYNPSDQTVLGGQKHIFEYLADEVLKRESAEIQEFLKRTSLFDRFCLPMVEFMYSDADCNAEDCYTSASRVKELIDNVERSNLFLIQLDSYWYRYHSLFTDFLRPLVPETHRTHLYSSASRWMEHNELYLDAVHYAIHAGELTRAAALLEDRYLGMLQMGEQTLLREIINDFPEDFLDDHPRLWLAKGWTYVISMDS